jgi:hypothetical protein
VELWARWTSIASGGRLILRRVWAPRRDSDLVLGYWESGDEPLPPGGSSGMPQGGESARKGPRRRYYRLTVRGVAALRTNVAEWQTFAHAVGRVLGGGDGELDPGWSG